MAAGKFVPAIQQEGILVITKVQMSTMPRDDHRQPASHSFRGGKVETLSPARKHERIGDVVEKVHFPLVKLFGNNLDRRGIFRGARQAFHPAVYGIGRVVERFDNEKYRVTVRESNTEGGYQLLDALAGEPGRDMEESERQGMGDLPASDPIPDRSR